MRLQFKGNLGFGDICLFFLEVRLSNSNKQLVAESMVDLQDLIEGVFRKTHQYCFTGKTNKCIFSSSKATP